MSYLPMYHHVAPSMIIMTPSPSISSFLTLVIPTTLVSIYYRSIRQPDVSPIISLPTSPSLPSHLPSPLLPPWMSDDGSPSSPSIDDVLFDRQVRLWGAHGQRLIRSSHLLVLGSSSTMVEMLKSLLVTGMLSLSIIYSLFFAL